jgi:hypothetical protein
MMMPPAAPAVAGGPTVPHLLTTLKQSMYPSEREMAAEQLSESSAHQQPEIVQCLVSSAKADPAATVRAACVRALARANANSAEAIAVLRELKNDRDPRVRQEAAESLAMMGLK